MCNLNMKSVSVILYFEKSFNALIKIKSDKVQCEHINHDVSM